MRRVRAARLCGHRARRSERTLRERRATGHWPHATLHEPMHEEPLVKSLLLGGPRGRTSTLNGPSVAARSAPSRPWRGTTDRADRAPLPEPALGTPWVGQCFASIHGGTQSAGADPDGLPRGVRSRTAHSRAGPECVPRGSWTVLSVRHRVFLSSATHQWRGARPQDAVRRTVTLDAGAGFPSAGRSRAAPPGRTSSSRLRRPATAG